MVDVTSVLGAVNTLLTGGSVTLGTMTLTGFEVPSEINFGGDQSIVIHKLPGGLRIIHSMGDDPVTPSWSGIFTGSFAATRARQMNTLRKAAAPVQLSFGPFSANVVIRRFEGKFQKSGYWIPYSIVCEVVPPPPGAKPVGNTALAGLIGNDAANALNSVSAAAAQVKDVAATAAAQASAVLARITPLANIAGINLNGVSAALNTGTGVIAGVTNLAQAPGVAAQAIVSFQTASTGIARGLNISGTGLSAIGSTAAAAGNGDPASSVADINNAGALAGAQANLSAAAGYTSRAMLNAALTTKPGGGS